MKALLFLVIFLFSLSTSQKTKDDKPVQLIYPSLDHDKLFLREDAINILEKIQIPIAIVGVVGPFHSGKSYLANQLLNRTQGFQIGPTVDPETRGLWIWGEPVIQTIDGEEVAVLFIDSEGLFSSNMTESYDAKIFAISSLLSSLLIYNTIHNIDQSYIDYIEILARRAQLFSMKMELKNADQKPDKKDVELMKFPPLIWVIQDFVLTLEEGVSPSKWLNDMLKTPNKDGKSSSSIPDIFESIECKPLFYPVTQDPMKLRHLDKVNSEELNSDYKVDVKDLREYVLNNVAVKKRGPAKMNGPLLIMLLRSLVQGANEGHFPTVPSVWDSFIRLASADAQHKSIKYLEKRYTKEFENNIFSDQHLTEKLKEVDETLLMTFKNLMLGVEVDEKRQESLDRALKSLKTRFSDLNNRKLEGLIKRKMEELNKVDSKKFKLPSLTNELQDSIDYELAEIEAKFDADLMTYNECAKFRHYKNMLLSTLKSEYEKLKQLNREKLYQLFEKAQTFGREKFVDFLKAKTVEPIPIGEVEQLFNQGKQIAIDHFHQESQISKPSSQAEDKSYSLEADRFVILLVRTLKEIFGQFKEENERKIYTFAAKKSVGIKRRFRDLLDAITLPQVSSNLQIEMRKALDIARDEFRKANEKYINSAGYNKALSEIETSMETETDHLIRQNQDQMKLYISTLGRAKEKLIDDAQHYYLDWTFRRHAVELVLADLESVIPKEDVRRETANVIVYHNSGAGTHQDIMPPKLFITFTHMFIALVAVLGTTLFFVFGRR